MTIKETDWAGIDFEITEKDAHWAEIVLRVLRDIDYPMLMCQAEKDVIEKALRMLLDTFSQRKEE